MGFISSAMAGGIAKGAVQQRTENEAREAQLALLKRKEDFTASENVLERENRLAVARVSIDANEEARQKTLGYDTLQKYNKLSQATGQMYSWNDIPLPERVALTAIGQIPIKGKYYGAFGDAPPLVLDTSLGIQLGSAKKNDAIITDAMKGTIDPDLLTADFYKYGESKYGGSFKTLVQQAYLRDRSAKIQTLKTEYLATDKKAATVEHIPSTNELVVTALHPGAAMQLALPHLITDAAVNEQAQLGGAESLIKLGNLQLIENGLQRADRTESKALKNLWIKVAEKGANVDMWKDLTNRPIIQYDGPSAAVYTKIIDLKNKFPALSKFHESNFIKTPKSATLNNMNNVADLSGISVNAANQMARRGNLTVTEDTNPRGQRVIESQRVIDSKDFLVKPGSKQAQLNTSAGSTTIVRNRDVPVTKGSNQPGTIPSNEIPLPIVTKDTNGNVGFISDEFDIDTNKEMMSAVSLYSRRAINPEVFDRNSKDVLRYKMFTPYYEAIAELATYTGTRNLSNDAHKAYNKLYNLIDKGYPVQGEDGLQKVQLFDLPNSEKRWELINGFIQNGIQRYFSHVLSDKGGESVENTWDGPTKKTSVMGQLGFKKELEMQKNYPAKFELYKNAQKLKGKLNDIMPLAKRYKNIRDRIGIINKLLEGDKAGNTIDNTDAAYIRSQLLSDPYALRAIRFSSQKQPDLAKNWHQFAASTALSGAKTEGAVPRYIHSAAQLIRDIRSGTQMFFQMFDIGNFRRTIDRDGKYVPGTGMPNFTENLRARNFHTRHDTENDHLTQSKLRYLEDKVLPGLQQAHKREFEDAEKRFDDAKQISNSEEREKAMDNASLVMMRAYLMARRDFTKVALTYYYAGALQGESGGRAISNEDYVIIFDSLWGGKVGGHISAGKFDEFYHTLQGTLTRNEMDIKYLPVGEGTVFADNMMQVHRLAQTASIDSYKKKKKAERTQRKLALGDTSKQPVEPGTEQAITVPHKISRRLAPKARNQINIAFRNLFTDTYKKLGADYIQSWETTDDNTKKDIRLEVIGPLLGRIVNEREQGKTTTVDALNNVLRNKFGDILEKWSYIHLAEMELHKAKQKEIKTGLSVHPSSDYDRIKHAKVVDKYYLTDNEEKTIWNIVRVIYEGSQEATAGLTP